MVIYDIVCIELKQTNLLRFINWLCGKIKNLYAKIKVDYVGLNLYFLEKCNILLEYQ